MPRQSGINNIPAYQYSTNMAAMLQLFGTESGIRREYKRVRDIIHKRVVTLQRAGELENSPLRRYSNGIPEAKNLTTYDIMRELQVMVGIAQNRKTSSLAGIKEVRRYAKQQFKKEISYLSNTIMLENGKPLKSDKALMDKLLKSMGSIMDLARSYKLDKTIYAIYGSGESGYVAMGQALLKSKSFTQSGDKYAGLIDVLRSELSKYENDTSKKSMQILSSHRSKQAKLEKLSQQHKAVANLKTALIKSRN